MPNRIIKESICTSDDFNDLSWFEQSFFMRLIVTVDDFGRYDARPKVIKGRMFPLSDVTEKQVKDALTKLSTAGMVALYEVDGKPYLQLCAWEDHQQIRATKSKYPAPIEHTNIELSSDDSKGAPVQADDPACEPLQASDITCNQLLADDIKCDQVQANVPVFVFEDVVENRESINDSREARAQAQTDARVAAAAAAAVAAQENGSPLVLAYQAQTGKLPSKEHQQELEVFRNRLSEGLVLEGFQRAVERGGQSWAYTKRILEDWDRKGVRSVEAAQAEQHSRKQGSQYIGPLPSHPEQMRKDMDRLDRLLREMKGISEADAPEEETT